MEKFELDVWVAVPPSSAAGPVERLKVVRSSGGGYLVLTIEHGSELDTWLETIEDVEAYLRELNLEWPRG